MKKVLILMAGFAAGILGAADLKVIAWYPKAFTGG